MKDLKLKLILETADRLSKPFKGIALSSNKLRDAVGATTGKLRKLEATSRSMDEFSSMQMTANRNAGALKKAQDRAQRLGRELNATEKPTKKLRNEFDRARNEVKKLKTQQSSYQNKLSQLRQGLNHAGVSTKDLSLSKRKLQQQIRATNKELDRYNDRLEQSRRKSIALARARKNYDRTLARQANVSFVGAAGAVAGGSIMETTGSMVMPALNFEEAMSKVGALSRVSKTSDAFQSLQDKAMQLGATTSFSATQAAEGMQHLAMAGFETNDILATMPGMLNLAKAGNMDLGQTANIASNILSGFKMEATEMGRVSDVLAAAFTRTNVDLEMLGETMKYVAPIANEVGVSVEEASAMAGLLGNVGIQGSQAGTAMRAIHNRLAAPPKMARKAIEQLNLSVKDANGNLLPMIDIMSEVAEKTEDMGSADRLAIFKKIAGEEAGTAFAELVNQGGAGEIAKFAEIYKNANGEAKRIADQMGDNVKGDLKAMSSAWESLNITLSNLNITPMRDMVQTATDMIRATTEWVKENPKFAGTLFKVVAAGGALMAALGGIAMGVAGILGPFAMAKMAFTTLGIHTLGFSGALGSLAKTVIPMVATAFRALGTAFLTNPIGLTITAIAAGAYLIYEYWEPISAFFVGIWNRIKAAFDGGEGWLATIFDFTPVGMFVNAITGAVDLIRDNWAPISEFFIGLWDGVKSTFGDFVKWISNGLDKVIEPVAWISEKLGGLFGDDEDEKPAKRMKTTRRIATTAVATTAAASPVAAGPGPATAVQAGQPASNHYEFNIQAAPGMNEEELARQIRRQIEEMNAEAAARQRSTLYDR